MDGSGLPYVMSPTKLDMELERYGLQIVKVTNNKLNKGQTPAYLLAHIVDKNVGSTVGYKAMLLLRKLTVAVVAWRARGQEEESFSRVSSIIKTVDAFFFE